jgi:cytochrome c-type biogenesis protein CcmH/NrfG
MLSLHCDQRSVEEAEKNLMQVESSSTATGWEGRQVYVLAAVCLALGLMLGYLVRGSASPEPAAPPTQAAGAPVGSARQMPSLDQLKHMADKQAAPLLAKLQNSPQDAALLVQVGNLYRSAHQFTEAAAYYAKSLQLEPRNVSIRTEMASCLYYSGDVDGALRQLEQALKDDPKDSNSLFNLGLIKWNEKKDARGALAAWEQLLRANPKLDAGKKAQVQKLMADVRKRGSPTN